MGWNIRPGSCDRPWHVLVVLRILHAAASIMTMFVMAVVHLDSLTTLVPVPLSPDPHQRRLSRLPPKPTLRGRRVLIWPLPREAAAHSTSSLGRKYTTSSPLACTCSHHRQKGRCVVRDGVCWVGLGIRLRCTDSVGMLLRGGGGTTQPAPRNPGAAMPPCSSLPHAESVGSIHPPPTWLMSPCSSCTPRALMGLPPGSPSRAKGCRTSLAADHISTWPCS